MTWPECIRFPYVSMCLQYIKGSHRRSAQQRYFTSSFWVTGHERTMTGSFFPFSLIHRRSRSNESRSFSYIGYMPYERLTRSELCQLLPTEAPGLSALRLSVSQLIKKQDYNWVWNVVKTQRELFLEGKY